MRTVRYNQGDEILEVTIRDATGARIEVRRCNLLDDKEVSKIIKWLMDKYGLKLRLDKNWLDLNNEFIKF